MRDSHEKDVDKNIGTPTSAADEPTANATVHETATSNNETAADEKRSSNVLNDHGLNRDAQDMTAKLNSLSTNSGSKTNPNNLRNRQNGCNLGGSSPFRKHQVKSSSDGIVESGSNGSSQSNNQFEVTRAEDTKRPGAVPITAGGLAVSVRGRGLRKNHDKATTGARQNTSNMAEPASALPGSVSQQTGRGLRKMSRVSKREVSASLPRQSEPDAPTTMQRVRIELMTGRGLGKKNRMLQSQEDGSRRQGQIEPNPATATGRPRASMGAILGNNRPFVQAPEEDANVEDSRRRGLDSQEEAFPLLADEREDSQEDDGSESLAAQPLSHTLDPYLERGDSQAGDAIFPICPLHMSQNPDPNVGLVQAIAVTGESTINIADLSEAQPFDEEANRQRKAAKEHKRRKQTVAGGVCLLILFALVIAGAVLGVNSRNGTSSSKKQGSQPATSTTGSSLDSTSPSSAPTAILNLLLDILPPTSISKLSDPSSAQSLAYDWLTKQSRQIDLPLWRQEQLFALATIFFAF